MIQVARHSETTVRVLRLRESVAWTLVGNFAMRGGQWMMLATLAWFGSPAAVGEYGFATAVCAPIATLVGLQLGVVLSADASRRAPFSTYWRLRLATSWIIPVLAIAIAYFLGRQGWPLLLAGVVALTRAIDSVSDLLYGSLRRADRIDVLGCLQAGRAVVSGGSFALAYLLTRDLLTAVVACSASTLACLAFLDVPAARKIESPLASDATGSLTARQLAAHSAPLGASAMLIAVYSYLPIFFVDAWAGGTALGVYVTVASIPLLADTVVRSGLQAIIPRLSTAFAQGNADTFRSLYRRSMAAVALFAAGATGVIALVGDQLVVLVFPEEFGRYPGLLFAMTIAASFGFLANSTPCLVAIGRYGLYLQLWIGGLAVLAVGLAVLTPSLGVYGAAYALVGANAVRAAATHLLMERVITRVFAAQRNDKNHQLYAVAA